MRILLLAIAGLSMLLVGHGSRADAPTSKKGASADVDRQFAQIVLPFLKANCIACHGSEKPKGGLDLAAFANTAAVAKDQRSWKNVLDQLRAGTMPPAKAKQPSVAARGEIVAWIEAFRKHEAKRTAGDPGLVPARRLSNAEYDNTIRDLTGVDIRPTREFPVDPANEAGFDNSADSLAMSPALLQKHLEAARRIANHVVFKPDGFDFAPFEVVTDTDRDKYSVRRIIDFYQKQRLDYADFFEAAWRYKHRAKLGKPNTTLRDLAVEMGISAKYLATVWEVLSGKEDDVGPIAALQALWRDLPAPPATPQTALAAMRDFVVRLRAKLVPEVKNLTAPTINNGSQCFVLWKNRQYAANRVRYCGGALQLKDLGLPADSAAARLMVVPSDKDAADKYEATFHRFCSTFPDAFFLSERARVYLNPEGEKKLGGRLLSAGFHSMTGYFRDDRPLYDMVLDEAGQRELDRLWQEFDFITTAPMRQHTSFIWFERTDSSYMRDPEFDVFRAEDKDCTSEAKIKALAEVYLSKAKAKGASDVAQEAIQVHFKNISAAIRWVEKAKKASEPSHLKALQDFAERAWRRPVSQKERDDIVIFYRQLCHKEELSHEDAIRDSIAIILMSPHFCYRTDLAATGSAVRQLTDYELANRLSYFLWSSMPDAELLKHAAAGDLRKPEVLMSQTRRMLKDERIRGLATEFAGNWLDFRRFEEHNAVDRGRFPSFNDELRQAMFEEPVRFFIDLAREDRPVLDLLYSNRTFVNPVLARHYGMPFPGRSGLPNRTFGDHSVNWSRLITTGAVSAPAAHLLPSNDNWVRIDNANEFGRGGLLPMAVFMTRNAPGLRTSPVKRGYWVVRRLLGETIPAPPNEVPELPNDEAKLGEVTLREALARHRQDKGCAVCHNRFDSFGLVFEGFGPVGERRTKDLGGRPVEINATFPNGSEGVGLDGLRKYIREDRQQDFVENLCRKLLAYAQGRNLQLSDEPAIEEMTQKLAASEYRFVRLVEMIVTSPQFLNKRGVLDAAKE